MKDFTMLRHITLATALAATLTTSIAPLAAAPRKPVKVTKATRPSAPARPVAGSFRPSDSMVLSEGKGQLINLGSAITDVFVASDAIADVQVKSPTQIYVFAKSAGETTIYATSKSGAVVFATNVRVGKNFNNLEQMLSIALPDANIKANILTDMIILSGNAATVDDVSTAQILVERYIGNSEEGRAKKTLIINRLKASTPLQVNLQVRIAEVSRSLVKEFGSNLITRDGTNGINFGIAQGRDFGSIGTTDLSALPTLDASSTFGLPAGSISLPFDPKLGQFVTAGTSYDLSRLGQGAGKTALAIAGKLFGIDAAAALDMAESEGLVTTLAQPNLTALSGETASFLAGGEIPIPLSTGVGQVSVEYKQYGVSLAFTPTVLNSGRISMRVRPEVSELSSEGAVRLGGFSIPGITTRRTETTIELGSGQSFMIAGLMRNNHNGTVDRVPGAGNVPVLGALFRSQSFRRAETELVIVVTPYLVQPVNAKDIVLPTDGYRSSNDVERILLGKMEAGKGSAARPVPTMAPPASSVGPGVPPISLNSSSKPSRKDRKVAAAPGLSIN